MNETRKQFELLFRDADGRYIEIRFIPPRDKDRPVRQHFFDATTQLEEAIKKALTPPAGYDSYVGVAARADERGTNDAVLDVRVLWADFDTYKVGQTDEDALQGLKGLPLPPTLIVHSGGGFHAYWKLDEPMDAGLARQTMKAMAKELGSDPATSDPARVLRVPGTSNNKLDQPRMVRIVDYAPRNVYAPNFIRGHFKAKAVETAALDLDPVMGVRTKDFIDHGVLPDDGQPERNHLVGIARNLQQCDYESSQAAEIMWQSIQKHGNSDPNRPWRETDIRRIVDSVWSSEPPPLEVEPAEEYTFVAAPVTGKLIPLTDADMDNRKKDLDYVVDQLLLSGEVVLLTGGFGVGKSWVALDAALAVADKQRDTFLGFDVQAHGPVLYIDEENPTDQILERLVKLGYRKGLLGSSLFVYSFAGVRLDDKQWQDELNQVVSIAQPRLVVFDTFVRFLSGSDENDNSAISTTFQDGILPLSRQYGASVLLLDHPKKSNDEVSRGAGDKVNAVDRALVLKGKAGDPLAQVKHIKPPRRGPCPDPFTVERFEDVSGVTLRQPQVERPNPRVNTEKDDLLTELLRKNGGARFGELKEATGIGDGELARRLAKLGTKRKDGIWTLADSEIF